MQIVGGDTGPGVVLFLTRATATGGRAQTKSAEPACGATSHPSSVGVGVVARQPPTAPSGAREDRRGSSAGGQPGVQFDRVRGARPPRALSTASTSGRGRDSLACVCVGRRGNWGGAGGAERRRAPRRRALFRALPRRLRAVFARSHSAQFLPLKSPALVRAASLIRESRRTPWRFRLDHAPCAPPSPLFLLGESTVQRERKLERERKQGAASRCALHQRRPPRAPRRRSALPAVLGSFRPPHSPRAPPLAQGIGVRARRDPPPKKPREDGLAGHDLPTPLFFGEYRPLRRAEIREPESLARANRPHRSFHSDPKRGGRPASPRGASGGREEQPFAAQSAPPPPPQTAAPSARSPKTDPLCRGRIV